MYAGIVTFYNHFVLSRYVHDRNVKHHTIKSINLRYMFLKMIQIIIRTSYKMLDEVFGKRNTLNIFDDDEM